MIRLQKYIALCGYTSRRKAEELILAGDVKINGETIKILGTKVDENTDKVTVKDEIISLVKDKIYIMVNKPRGYVSTVSDQFNRKTVIDLVPEITDRIYPVGRLDYETSGLLILTNDGELTNKITHPKYHVEKTYLVTIDGEINSSKLNMLKNGVDIGGYITKPAIVKKISSKNGKTKIEIKIREGKNRQIRKMFDFINSPVLKLERTSIGRITVDDLDLGKWRYLTGNEVEYLYNSSK